MYCIWISLKINVFDIFYVFLYLVVYRGSLNILLKELVISHCNYFPADSILSTKPPTIAFYYTQSSCVDQLCVMTPPTVCVFPVCSAPLLFCRLLVCGVSLLPGPTTSGLWLLQFKKGSPLLSLVPGSLPHNTKVLLTCTTHRHTHTLLICALCTCLMVWVFDDY